MTYNRSLGSTGAKIYVDGEDDTDTSTLLGHADPSSGTMLLCLGKSPGANDFSGSMDDVRTYSRALSPDAVEQLAQESDKLAYWKFDYDSGSPSTADSWGSNDATLTNVSSDIGHVEYGAYFTSSSSSYAYVPNVLSGKSECTFSAWAKLTYNSTDKAILGLWDTGSDEQIKVWHDAGNGWAVTVDDGGTDRTVSETSNPTSIGQWTHVAVTFKKNGSMKLYVDGQEVGTSVSVTSDVATSATSLFIGAINDGGGGSTFYDGTIDEMRVYGSEMSAAQIESLYKSTLSTFVNPGTVSSVQAAGEGQGASDGRLKYSFGAEAYRRLVAVAAGGDPGAATETQLAECADEFYAYSASGLVTKTLKSGSCTSCSPTTDAGVTYKRSVKHYDETPGDVNNSWRHKTIEETRDSDGKLHKRRTIYSNESMQVMLDVTDTFDPDDESEFMRNAEFTHYYYDSTDTSDIRTGLADWVADNAALDLPADLNELDQYADVLNQSGGNYAKVEDSAGLIHATTYAETTTGGDVARYVKYTGIKNGETGTEIRQTYTKYTSRTDGTDTIYPVSETQRFPWAVGGTPGTALITAQSYTWHGSTLVIEEQTTQRPVTEGASPKYLQSKTYYDEEGRLTWSMDEVGFMSHTEYDDYERVSKTISDVDTTSVADEPAGWATVTGGGLHLETDYTYDSLDRIIQTLGPPHNVLVDGASKSVRSASWTLYSEGDYNADDETLTASGYYSVTDTHYKMVGGISVSKTDKAGRTIENILLAQAARTTDGGTAGKLDVGDTVDSTTQTNYLSWSVNEYDDRGFLDNTRIYHTVPASGAGTLAANYNHTYMYYDDLGRQNKTVQASAESGTPLAPTAGVSSWTFWNVDDSTYGTTVREVRSYPHVYSDSGFKLSGPISVTLTDADGNTVRSFTATATIAAATPTGAETLTELSRTGYTYDWRNRTDETRSYHTLPAIGADGSSGTNYFKSEVLAYDNFGRVHRRKAPSGAITATVYEADRVKSQWLGADDTSSALNNPGADPDMEKISYSYYDVGRDGAYADQADVAAYATATYTLKPIGGALDGSADEFTHTDHYPYSALESGLRVSWTKPDVGPASKTTSDGVANSTSYTYANGDTTDVLAKSTVVPGYETISSIIYAKSFSQTYEVDGDGPATTNKLETISWLDQAGRTCKTQNLNGSLHKTIFDAAGRVSGQYICSAEGASESPDNLTNDTIISSRQSVYDTLGRLSESKIGTTDANTETVSKTYYLASQTTGAETGRVTGTAVLKPGGTSSQFVTTKYDYDIANSKTSVTLPDPDATLDPSRIETTTDPLGRTTFTKTYNDTSSTLLAQSKNVYTGYTLTASQNFKVSSGTAGDYTETAYAYDNLGRVWRVTTPSGAFRKTVYSLAGPVLTSYLSTDDDDSDSTAGFDTTGDKVITRTDITYDEIGNVLYSVTYNREHDYTGTDALTNGTARLSTICNWYDDLFRIDTVADYGTNGGTVMTSVPGTKPTYSDDDVLTTAYTYDGYGRQETVIASDGAITKTWYDSSSRTEYIIENYQSDEWTTEPSAPADRDADECRITKYGYNLLDQVTTQTAVDPNYDGNTGDNQVTTYTYGPDTNCTVDRAELLLKVEYPDKVGASDVVAYTYHENGARKTVEDQRSVTHTYTYDDLGRLTEDDVDLTGATGVDDSVLSITRTYTQLGNLKEITSYDAASSGTVVNQVLYEYDTFNRLDKEYQEHTGAKDGNTLFVQYHYDDTASSSKLTKGGRLNKITYPNAREVHYLYVGDTAGVSDDLSRVTAIATDTTRGASDVNVIASYEYVGASTLVRKDYPTPDIRLDYYGEYDYANTELDEVSGTYAGLDRFGRITQQFWYDYGAGAPLFDLHHDYDNASNRTYADRQVYKGSSQFYTYDELNRLAIFKAGKMSYDGSSIPDGIESYWLQRQQEWTLTQTGNQTSVKDFGQDGWYIGGFNKANEYDDDDADRGAKGTNGKPYRLYDSFSTDTSSNYVCPGANDSFTVNDSSNGALELTAGSTADTFDTGDGNKTEDQARAFVITGEAVGPTQDLTRITFPADVTAGYAGLVFGYKSANDYWMLVLEVGADDGGRRILYHVVDGVKDLKEEVDYDVDANGTYSLYGYAQRNSLGRVAHTFDDGYPSGKVGLVSSAMTGASDPVQFDYLWTPDDAMNSDMLGRWINNTCTSCVSTSSGDRLYGTANWDAVYNPKLLRNVRLDEFQAIFSIDRKDSIEHYAAFVFNAKDQNHWNRIQIYHKGTTQTAPYGQQVIDGGLTTGVTATRDNSAMPAQGTPGDNDRLWARVECDGGVVKVWCKIDNTATEAGDVDWTGVNYCFSTSSSAFTNTDGGMIGFLAGASYVDNLTIKRRNDADTGWEAVEETIEGFDVDANGRATDPLEHDAAGNLTFDGQYKYFYDAWNRLAEVKRAYRDHNESPTDDVYDLTEGSTIATMAYDGTSRRVSKKVENSGDWDITYNYYYNGQSLIETRDDATENEGTVLKQHVWGMRYVDELIQIGINQDPANNLTQSNDENVCERFFWVCQDANYNVIGVVSPYGDLIERYEYTPYGQRTIFTRGWIMADFTGDGVVNGGDQTLYDDDYGTNPTSRADVNGDGVVNAGDYTLYLDHYGESLPANDTLAMYPTLESFRSPVTGGGGIGLCDIGHQGLIHDKEFGLVYNRARYYHPTLARFTGRDPLEYHDGMNLYEYVRSNSVGYVDPNGSTWDSVQIAREDKRRAEMAQRRREEIAKVEAELAKADGNLRVFYKKAEIMGKLMEGCPPDPAKLDAAARDMRSSYDKYLVSVMYSNFKLSKFLNYYGPVDQDFTHLHKRVNDLKISHGGLGPKKNQWRGIKIAVTMVNSGINRSADNYDTAVVVLREIDKWGNRAALATGIAGLAKGAIQIAAAEIAETTIKEGLKAAAAYAAKEVAKYGIRMGAAYAVSEGLMGMGVDRKYVNIGFTAYHMWTIGNMLRSVPNARAQPKPKGSTLNERINANGQANPGSLSARQAGTGNRLLRDARVNPQAPARKPLNRNVSRSSTQNARAQRDAARLRAAGAEDVRINQQQVNAAGERVGINRPDLHYTNKGQRVYIEYESPGSTRGPAHRERILANDSSGKVIIRKNAE